MDRGVEGAEGHANDPPQGGAVGTRPVHEGERLGDGGVVLGKGDRVRGRRQPSPVAGAAEHALDEVTLSSRENSRMTARPRSRDWT
jgi:hypothetical protein